MEAASQRQGAKPTTCPNHLNFADPDRCEVCEELHRDFPPEEKAELPGLKQSFPVVAQHSDTRLAHLEPQNPDTVLAKYQQIEDVNGAYAFERNKLQEALEIEQRKLQRQRQRTAAASREADHAISQGVWQVGDAQKAADERRRRAEHQLQALEVQARQQDILLEEAKREAERRIEEAKGLNAQEKAHLQDVEQLLRAARENTLAADRRAEDVEAASRARIRARAEEIEKQLLELKAQEDAAVAESNARVSKVKELCQTRLSEQQSEAAKFEQGRMEHVELEALRKMAATEEAERRRQEAKQRLETQRLGLDLHKSEMSSDCDMQVVRVQRREEQTKRHFESFEAGPVTAVKATSEVWFNKADRKALCTKASVEQTAFVLGHHYKTRWNYTPTVDSKLADIMQGTLHGRPAAGGEQPPSPRVLKPPAALPQLPFRAGP
mmetsp:Transcript_72990/g.128928  ORF Transcript_72990/g.128928 Transcript_72990/m.128928 type:complete len:438 (+) Transcript_72990:87-1400(+)|eukprot:CAMPEP_0197628686 /NCGR_PEP_ID=MMETSP1338-20131121/6883_1 /TAXON_ID=43686 ORGANISM="Pelagodinium beii, Strain RCC1491" /NCGR_SAMPLE_ID=MMETSP1338 /ASSEMBLY_ACC=CAM_ASM_000754 /LENGTH=437 /DNA_ID=CAMNT_0043199677 /DNA_START=86 /DNA_END=1399 /DNA_ORIENTATION=+